MTLVNGNIVYANDGNIYRYVGAGGSVTLSTTNYQDGSLWQIIPGDIIATVSNFSTSEGVRILTTGNTVQNNGDGTAANKGTGNVYQYLGADGTVDLASGHSDSTNFSNTSLWKLMPGVVTGTPVTYVNFTQSQGVVYLTPNNTVESSNGSVYRYIGGNATVTLGNFSDQSLWQLVPANVVGVVVNFTESQGSQVLATGKKDQTKNSHN